MPGLVRRPLLALGLLALLLTGAHAAADRLDDLAFTVISGMDAVLDALVGAAVDTVGPWFEPSASARDAVIQAAESWIDLDAKLWLAQRLALLAEAWIALVLALPLLDPRIGLATRQRVRAAVSAALLDPTALSWAAPAATLLAGLAGALLAERELSALARAQLAGRGVAPALIAALPLAAGAVAFALTVTLALRATARALVRARALADRDRDQARTRLRRALRGVFLALTALPASAFAFFDLLFSSLPGGR
ncbi:MAG: hypothetical protein U1E65_36595 [Myxococcota bacterium]